MPLGGRILREQPAERRPDGWAVHCGPDPIDLPASNEPWLRQNWSLAEQSMVARAKRQVGWTNMGDMAPDWPIGRHSSTATRRNNDGAIPPLTIQ